MVSCDYTPGEEPVTGDVVVARELHGFQRKFDDGHGFLGFEVATEVVDVADILVGHSVIDVVAEFELGGERVVSKCWGLGEMMLGDVPLYSYC